MTALELMEGIGAAEEVFLEPVLMPPAKRKLSRPIRTALILAAVIALLALAGVAAKEAGYLEGLFPEKYETIEDYVNHIAVTVENDGLRLTLHEAVTDGYTVLLAYTVERLDGKSMEGWTPEDLIRPLSAEGWPVAYGSSWYEPLDTGEINPAKQTYLWRAYRWTGLGRVYYRLFGLKNTETGETFTPGYLEAETELKPCLTKTARMQGDLGAEKLYTDIVLSPFGLRAYVLTNLGAMTEDSGGTWKPTLNDPWTGSLELVFTDGEEQTMDLSAGAYLRLDSSSRGVSVLSVRFDELVDIRRVKALRIDGVDYPLERGTIPRERLGLWDPDAAQLEHTWAWLYGEHEPAHPELCAEGTTEAGEAVTLSLDGIWTDGKTTEVLLKATLEGPENWPIIKEDNYARPVHMGGHFVFRALDARGEALAVGVRFADAVDGLFAIVAECPEKAETLVLSFFDAELTIPLDMKKLGKLPQVTPQEPRRTVVDPENQARNRQRHYDDLFAGFTPAEVDYAGDNGLCRMSVAHLALRGGNGSGSLRAWVVCTYLAGNYNTVSDDLYTNFSCYVLSDGRQFQVSSRTGLGGMSDREAREKIYCIELDFQGDFDTLDALRLVWTPPAGDRITLDLAPTE